MTLNVWLFVSSKQFHGPSLLCTLHLCRYSWTELLFLRQQMNVASIFLPCKLQEEQFSQEKLSTQG